MYSIEIRTVTDKSLRIEINHVRRLFRYDKNNFYPVLYKIFKYLDKNNMMNLYYIIRSKVHDRLTKDTHNQTYGKTLTYFTV